MWKFLCIIAALLVATASAQTSCTQRWQCTPVSNDYNYVDCVNGFCKCLYDQGFTGSASVQSKCSCASPSSILWEQGKAYCLDLDRATLLQVKDDRASILEQQVRRVYDSLIYPTPLFIINGSLSLNDVFALISKGRIDPVGIFHDQKTLIEYYYVFAIANNVRVVSIDYAYLFAKGNEAFVRVNILFAVEVAPGVWFPVVNATQLGSYTFNDENLITSVDVAIPNIGILAVIPDRHARNIQFCNEQIAYCPQQYDPEGYYTSFEDCMEFIEHPTLVRHLTLDGSANVTYNEPAGNTDVCRWFHSSLSIYDNIHCTHAGKTGGGKCTDVNPPPYYLTYHNEKF